MVERRAGASVDRKEMVGGFLTRVVAQFLIRLVRFVCCLLDAVDYCPLVAGPVTGG